jgi:3-phosphoshikimate 1-carboxyvinyltransferase
MKPFVVKPASRLRGEISLAGDKSIAHRAVILSAISGAKTTIVNFPANKDCLVTLAAFQKLGIKITKKPSIKALPQSITVTVKGLGLRGLKKPKGQIFMGDSGTSLRLILGILAGQGFEATVAAGRSLSKRPMLRVTKPLRMMGAEVKAKGKRQKSKLEEYPPIVIKGTNLRPITYKMPVASAQVKSALLLAGLYAKLKL